MDNHCRMYVSIFVIFVSAVSYSWAECQQVDQPNATDVIAWAGKNIDLHCETNPSSILRLFIGLPSYKKVQRYWKRGEEILTMADVVWTCNSRIESRNQSNILTINNVNVDDKGHYTCVINTKPIQRLTFNLQVKEFTCESPDKPCNGDFKRYNSTSDTGPYKVNDQIQYVCKRGFELVGEAIRTCSGPTLVWTPDEPFCQPDYIIRLQKSVTAIESKITAMESEFENNITTLANIITTLENKMAAMETKFEIMDNRTACQNECRNGFIKLGDLCYQFHPDKKSWADALSACQSIGSTLAYPRNSAENKLLKDHVSKNFKIFDWWLGGTDVAKEGTWVWTHDQSPITYTDWYPGEPNNGAPDNCLCYCGAYPCDFLWVDAPCTWKRPFICQ